MNAKEQIELAEHTLIGMGCKVRPGEVVALGRARLRIDHRRPTVWVRNPRTGLLEPDPRSFESLGDFGETENLITNAGRIFLHKQGYDLSGLSSNGLNYIGLSIDAVTETATSTTLSTEIAANGLSRAQGSVTLPTGAGNQTVVDHTFTCVTAPQAAQKAALFTAASAGTMNHVLAFTSRSLQIADTLQTTFTLTLG
jgi:hypothetical protein